MLNSRKIATQLISAFAALLIFSCEEPKILELDFRVPPMLVSVSPSPGKVDVPVDTKIDVRFAENTADIRTIKSGFSVNGLSAADYTVTVQQWGHMQITPLIPLAPGTVYTMTLSTSITNYYGTPLEEPYTWSFTTAN